jgi:membrane-bound ClpP family serine protease
MILTIDFNAIATFLAYVGIVFLFLLWLIISRKLVGLLLVLAGSVTLLVVVRSDHNPTHLAGILTAAAIIASLVIVGWMMIAVRIARRSMHVNRPSRSAREAMQAKMVATAERQAAEISAARPAHKRPSRTGSQPRSGYVVNPSRKRSSRARVAAK